MLYVTAYRRPAAPGGARGTAICRKVLRVDVPPLADSQEPVDLGNLILERVAADHTQRPASPGSEKLILAPLAATPAAVRGSPDRAPGATDRIPLRHDKQARQTNTVNYVVYIHRVRDDRSPGRPRLRIVSQRVIKDVG